MEHSRYPQSTSLGHHQSSVCFRVTRVNDQWPPFLRRESDLRPKCGKLGVTRRIVVVVVESALPDCHGA